METHTNNKWWLSLKFWAFTFLGVFCAVVAFNGFLIPNHFIDGGINGVSILISHVFHINIGIPIVVFNLPFVYMGYKKIGKSFAIKSLIAVILLALAIQVIEVPHITDDSVLTAIFGGVFIGLGIGFVIKAGGVIDGFEVIAAYTNLKSKFSANEFMLTFNICLFIALSFTFGLETAMYSIITFYTALKVADYVVDGFEQYTSLTVVSAKYAEIREVLVKRFGKAVSVYKGERGYLPSSFDIKEDCDIIVAIMTRLEVFAIEKAIYEIDPNAFITMQSIREVRGGVIKRLRHH